MLVYLFQVVTTSFGVCSEGKKLLKVRSWKFSSSNWTIFDHFSKVIRGLELVLAKFYFYEAIYHCLSSE